MRPLFRLLTALSLAACGEGASIELTATPAEVPADGVASALVTAKPLEGDVLAADGTQLTLTTTFGSFRSDDPDAATLVKPVELGAVEARLFSATKPGEARVRAEFQSATGQRIDASITVRFVEPPEVAGVSFTCDARNLGALVPAAPLLKAECRAAALDAGGGALPAARLGFMAEAGVLAWEEGQASGRRLVYSTGGVLPLDVAPLAAEPRWEDGLRTRNPRDGVVTLVAYAERPSPAARGQGEPYVDADDSGAYERGEVFFDMDGDSEYDGPGSGVASAWAATRLVWSGALAVTPVTAAVPATLSVPDGGSEAVTFHLADANLNALAAGRGGALSLDAGGAATVVPAQINWGDIAGFELASDGDIVDAALATGWLKGTAHTVWVVDAASDSASDEAFSLSGTLWRPLTPGVAGGIAPPRSEAFPSIPGVLRGR